MNRVTIRRAVTGVKGVEQGRGESTQPCGAPGSEMCSPTLTYCFLLDKRLWIRQQTEGWDFEVPQFIQLKVRNDGDKSRAEIYAGQKCCRINDRPVSSVYANCRGSRRALVMTLSLSKHVMTTGVRATGL